MHRRPSAPLVISLVALFVAVGGPAQAARLITAKDVKRNSLTGKQIKNGSLALADLTKGSQTSLRRTPDGSVTSVQLAPGAVNGDRLADNSVDSAKVVDNSLITNDIATNAVGADEIAPNSVQSDEVTANSLNGGDIADASIDGGEVIDGGLRAPDVARFTGTLTLNFGTIDLGDCASVSSTSLTPIIASQNISDDVLLVTPPASFPSDGVAISAKPAGSNQVEVTVCNVEGPLSLLVGERTLRYLSIDAG